MTIIFDFIYFCGRCIWEGCHFTLDTFGIIDGICVFVTAGLYWKKENHQVLWETKWEPFVKKYAFLVMVVQLTFGVLCVAPYLQYRDAKKESDGQEMLKSQVSNQGDTIISQNATIQSLQTQLSDKDLKLKEIESVRDPSAKAIKRRALILCKQLENFYHEYQASQEIIEKTNWAQENTEKDKLGWPPPTNDVEKAEWKQKNNKISDGFALKERIFEAEWQSKFINNYYGQLKVIRDELASLGLRDEVLDSHLENPFFTNVWFSQRLTMTIAYLANQIKE